MKAQILKIVLPGLFLLGTLHAKAQKEQSAIYDAIALMNARQNVSVLQLPGTGGYKVVDPVTGTVIRDGQAGPLNAAELVPDSAKDVIKQVLARIAGLAADATDEQLKTAYAGNPFLKDLLETHETKAALTAAVGAKMGAISYSTESGSAGVTLTSNLANGVADFLIKRANEELTVSIISKLQDFIARYPEFKVLFPRTIALIGPIEPYDYAKTLNALKSALQDDLDQMPGRLQLLYFIPRYQLINSKVPVLTLGFTAATVVNGINGKFGLSKTLHDLDTCNFLNAKNNYASTIRILCTLSNGLRDKLMSQDDGKEYFYIDPSILSSATGGNAENMVLLAQYFTGIIFQQVKAISFYTGSAQVTAGDILKSWKGSGMLINFFNKVQTACAQLADLQQKLEQTKSDDATNTASFGKNFFSSDLPGIYARLLGTSMSVSIAFLQAPDQKGLKDQLTLINDTWPSFSTNGINMIKAFSQKDYSSATQDLGELLKAVTGYLDAARADNDFTSEGSKTLADQAARQVTELTAQIESISKEIKNLPQTAGLSAENAAVIGDQKRSLTGQLAALNLKLYSATYQNKNAEKELFILSKVISYYQLFAALSQANNSADVEALLETYALPAGSSRVKKETDFNIALNAYVGGFFGRSRSTGSGFSNTYGLTAPIGFTISHGFKEIGSLSFFAGVIDIGSVIRYKLNNQGQYEQNINFAGLVSPSVHLVYGLPWYLPLSIGAGYQWTTPTTSGSNQIHLMPHFNAFIAVDIPLFNLTAVRKGD